MTVPHRLRALILGFALAGILGACTYDNTPDRPYNDNNRTSETTRF